MYTTEEMCNIATQHITSNAIAKLLPVLGSSNVAPSTAAVRGAKRGTKGSRNRHKQCPRWVKAVADYDYDSDKKADLRLITP
jgi:hypothetical protein